MVRATYEGTVRLLNGARPFVLSRAGYAGIQRYSAVWTGDNAASEEHMFTAVRLVNSIGLSGIPFTGADVYNDFERVAFDVFDGLHDLWAELERRSGEPIRLAGAGPAISRHG